MSTIDSEQTDEPLLPQNGGMKAIGSTTEKPVEKMVAIEDTPKSLSLEISSSIMDVEDKLDEFSRLQLEMAELNKTELSPSEHSNDKNSKSPNHVSEVEMEQVTANSVSVQNDTQKEFSSPINDKKGTTNQNGQKSDGLDTLEPSCSNAENEILDHEDLIAVLKGETVETIDIPSEPRCLGVTEVEKVQPPKSKNVTTADADLIIEGVTIEGEGEYQIMEVVDDFDDETEINTAAGTVSKEVGAGAVSASGSSSGKSTVSSKLTREEERAMAMEQIAGLNARAPRRRKQDIKPLQVETSELVSTLGADWSDDEDIGASGSERSLLSKSSKVSKKENLPTIAQVASQETKFIAGEQTPIPELIATGKKRRRSVGGKVTNVIVIPSVPQADMVVESTNEIEPASTVAQESVNSTGFKRTRAIKRRIIWDPDAPETAISYANLVRTNAKDRQLSTSPIAVPKPRPVTPKDKRAKIELPIEKKVLKRAATPSKPASKESPTTVGNDASENLEMPSTSKQMLRSQTISPVANGSMLQSGGKKKKISEIDRLMRDEGAANMLSSLESGRGKLEENDDDKPHKPLMRSRGGTAEKVTKKDSTSPLTATAVAAKNKRGPKSKQSASWDFVYQKKQLSEDSMIIRRRSNSSYSSTASQHRLSLDGPAGTSSKTNSKSADSSFADVSCDEATIDSVLEDLLPHSSENTDTDTNDLVSVNSSRKSTASMKQSHQQTITGGKSFEFAKPKTTKSNAKTPNRRTKAETTVTTEAKKILPKRAGPGRPPNSERQQNTDLYAVEQVQHANEPSSKVSAVTSEVHVRKAGKIAQVIFSLTPGSIGSTFSFQLMNKIVDALDGLANDNSCAVVTMTTNALDFCQGVDFTCLATGSVEQRKSSALVLATATKNYLKTLATFPKPLIVGIHGSVVGLGVTQLPLFDVVIASDKTTLETPYAKIGQVPEGYCLWQNLPSVRGTAKTKLFWLGEKMHSTEASSSGLICKLTTADKVNDDVLNIAKGIANMSAVAYHSMKNAAIQSRLEAVISALDDEFDEIVKQWTSIECYNKFKKFIDVKHF